MPRVIAMNRSSRAYSFVHNNAQLRLARGAAWGGVLELLCEPLVCVLEGRFGVVVDNCAVSSLDASIHLPRKSV